MSTVALVITGASLIALSILHEDKKIDDGGAILTLIVALGSAPGLIMGDPLVTIVAPFGIILCIVGSLYETAKSNRESELELQRDAAQEAAGPAVVPLSEDELAEIFDWVLGQYGKWRNASHSHDSIVIACEPERMRFSGNGFTAYRPHSHCVYNDPYEKCFSPSEWDGRWDAQKAYRRQLSERILALLASQESGYGPYGKHSSSFWIDDVGDILGPWEKNHA